MLEVSEEVSPSPILFLRVKAVLRALRLLKAGPCATPHRDDGGIFTVAPQAKLGQGKCQANDAQSMRGGGSAVCVDSGSWQRGRSDRDCDRDGNYVV